MDAAPAGECPAYPAPMPETGPIKITVQDREKALSELAQHLDTGRLSLPEFDDRSAAALAATTKAQLAELFSDLPGLVALPAVARGARWRPIGAAGVTATAVLVIAAIVFGHGIWLIALVSIAVLLVRARR